MKDAPEQPSPIIVNAADAASGQSEYNREAALEQRALNMVDQFGPEGSTTYGYTGETIEGIPQASVTRTYSPEQQKLYDLSTDLSTSYGEIGNTQLDAVRSSLEEPFTVTGMGPAPVVNEATRNASRDAILARLQPQFDRDRGALETSLANQGFMVGSEGYDEAIDERNRSLNDAYLGADIASGNEMARMYGLETNARDRGINELLMERTQPLTELSAYMSGAQPTGPTFLPTPQGQIAAPDFMGGEYANAGVQNQFAQNAYNQKMGTYNANLEGLYGIGAAGASAAGWKWSDRRLKTNIKRIGRLANGLAVYAFRYVWGGPARIGLMADEVRLVRPRAVVRIGAFDAVNYAEAVR